MNARSKGVFCIVSGFACAALLTLASCGDDDNDNPTPVPTATPVAATTVNVTLQEFSVTLDRASAPAGRVTFHVSNIGEDMHEFLVIKTDLAPDALPTEDDGSYEEDGPGTDLLEEIEEIDPGESEDLTIDLSAAKYVLICNMVHQEDDELEVHYALGMHTAFRAQ